MRDEFPAPVSIEGLPLHPVDCAQLVELIGRWAAGPQQRRLANLNVYAMNLARDDQAFARAVASADLVFCDGYGVKLGARLLGHRLPARMTPPDWIDALAKRSATDGIGVFALGDEPGVAARFQQTLAARHPGYVAAGAHHGFFTAAGPESDAVIAAINASGARVLLAGMGMPRQETWLAANAARLAPRVLLPVGALFRWVSGIEHRAPRWVTDHGLEWLARLVRHPRRHFRRYVIGNPRFFLRVARVRLTGGGG